MNDKKKFNWSMIILTTVVTLFPILIGMYLYNELPENLPGHFNFKNEIDRYDPKWVVVFIYPSVMALLHFVLCVGTSFQMRKFEKENMIRETEVDGRKRSYIITKKGLEALQEEYKRLQILINDGKDLLGGMVNETRKD